MQEESEGPTSTWRQAKGKPASLLDTAKIRVIWPSDGARQRERADSGTAHGVLHPGTHDHDVAGIMDQGRGRSTQYSTVIAVPTGPCNGISPSAVVSSKSHVPKS